MTVFLCRLIGASHSRLSQHIAPGLISQHIDKHTLAIEVEPQHRHPNSLQLNHTGNNA